MVIRHYKALKEFEFDGETVKIGQELILKEREGEKLLKEKKVAVGRMLDPKNDADDAKKVEEAEAKYKAKYENNFAKEKARDEKKEDELIQEDEKAEDEVEDSDETDSEDHTETPEEEETVEETPKKKPKAGKNK